MLCVCVCVWLCVLTAHGTAEVVELRLCLCSVDEKGVEKTLYRTNFTYFFDQKAFMAEAMLQSVSNNKTSQLLYGLLPPLSSAEAVRDYDMYLTEAVSEVAIPEGWNMVGSKGKGGNAITTVEGERLVMLGVGKTVCVLCVK